MIGETYVIKEAMQLSNSATMFEQGHPVGLEYVSGFNMHIWDQKEV